MSRPAAGAALAAAILIAGGLTACSGTSKSTATGATTVPPAPVPSASHGSPAATPGSQVPGSVPVSSVRLDSALLSRFGDTRRITPAAGASTWAVLAPLPQNDVLAKRYGASDFPVRDARCRPWVAGLWGTAVHTPKLSTTSAAAITALYGAYSAAGTGSSSASSVPLMEISEVIVVVPSPADAAMLAAGPVPAACQHTQIWARPTPTAAFGWHPGLVRQLPVSGLGQGSSAVSVSTPTAVPYLGEVWSDTIRMGTYVVQVLAIMWPGIRDQVQVLQQLAGDAYGQAHAVLGSG
jgi:hypothetical protein